MTAAEDRREDLEALLWKHRVPPLLVAKILVAADAYAKASRPRGPKKPPEPKKPPAVHYAAAGSEYTACLPSERWSSTRLVSTVDPQDVTCQRCRKTPAWREAGGAS